MTRTIQEFGLYKGGIYINVPLLIFLTCPPRASFLSAGWQFHEI